MIDRDERLRKLEPKIGSKTARALWLGSLDPQLRRFVDPYIGALSDSLLQENYKHEKILLPPPEENVLAGPIDIGEVWYDGARGRLGLYRSELNKHVGIVGASGSGKSTLGLRLAKSLLENDFPIVVFDVKRTWRTLLEFVPERDVRIITLSRPEVSPFYHNFLIPPEGIPATLFDQITCSIGDEVLYGGLGSKSIVKAAMENLRRMYPMPDSVSNHFTMRELSQEVQRLSGDVRIRRAGDWSATAQRITQELSSPPLGDIINVRRNLMEKDIDQAKLVIFEMDLITHYQYTYFITSFLMREYFKRLNTDNPDELERVIIFEEAGRIFNQPFPQPTFDMILREVREKGLGIVWLNQSASDVNSTAWANTNTLFVFKQISARDINEVGAAVAFEQPTEKQYAARLRTGEAIVRLPDRYCFPLLVRTDDFEKVCVPDAAVKELAQKHLAALGAPVPESGIKEENSEIQEADFKQQPQRDGQSAAGVRGVPDARSPGVQVNEGVEGLQASQAVAGVPRAAGSNRLSWLHGVQEQEAAGVQVREGFASKHEEYLCGMAHLLAMLLGDPRSQEKPVTYVYVMLGLSKTKGTKIKKMLLDAGLAQEVRSSANGRYEVHLVPSLPRAEGWLKDHEHLLSKSLVSWQTKRFGGQLSSELGELAIQWATKVRHAKIVEQEASDGFGGKWDVLCEDADKRKWVIEIITGESKTYEAIHVQKARAAGLPIVCLCADDMIKERVRRYLAVSGIREDGRNVSLIISYEVSRQLSLSLETPSATSTNERSPPVVHESKAPRTFPA